MALAYRSFGALACVAVLALATPAFADAYDAAMARGVAAKEKAVDTNDPSAWAEALKLFEEADGLKSTKDSKYEVANAAAKLKEDDLAVEAYEAALALGLGGKPKEKAQAFLKANEPKMARVDVKGPAGAQVYVGSRARGVLPRAPLVVFAGTSKIKVVSGAKSVEIPVEAKAGEKVTLDADAKLAELDVPPPPPPPKDKPKPPSPTVPISDDGASARALGWSLIIGGGLVGTAGLVFVVVSGNRLESERAFLLENCSEWHDKPDSCRIAKTTDVQTAVQSSNNTIATWSGVRIASFIGLGTGFTVAAIGAIRLLTAPPPPHTAATLVPQVSVLPGGAYVGLSGVFF